MEPEDLKRLQYFADRLKEEPEDLKKLQGLTDRLTEEQGGLITLDPEESQALQLLLRSIFTAEETLELRLLLLKWMREQGMID